MADPVGLADDVMAQNLRPPARRCQEGGQDPEGRRLARAVGSDEPEQVGPIHGQVQAGEGRHLAVDPAQAMGLHSGHRRWRRATHGGGDVEGILAHGIVLDSARSRKDEADKGSLGLPEGGKPVHGRQHTVAG